MLWCSPQPNTFNPPVDSRIILAGVGHQNEYNRDITNDIGLRCFPVWQRAVHQADVEPNAETVLIAQASYRDAFSVDIEEERAALTTEALLRNKGARNDHIILQRQGCRELPSTGNLCTRIY